MRDAPTLRLDSIPFGCDHILTESIFQTQMNLVENLSELFLSGEYRLLIIDSIIALYRVEFLGRGELAERQQMLGKLLNHCTKLATGSNFQIKVF
jgi:meiotic recombination protein DMC1